MDKLILDFIASLTSQGPLVASMAIAVWYLKKADDRKEARNQVLIDLMNKERIERILILEKHVDECNQRHDEKQRQYEGLLIKIANIERHAPGMTGSH